MPRNVSINRLIERTEDLLRFANSIQTLDDLEIFRRRALQLGIDATSSKAVEDSVFSMVDEIIVKTLNESKDNIIIDAVRGLVQSHDEFSEHQEYEDRLIKSFLRNTEVTITFKEKDGSLGVGRVSAEFKGELKHPDRSIKRWMAAVQAARRAYFKRALEKKLKKEAKKNKTTFDEKHFEEDFQAFMDAKTGEQESVNWARIWSKRSESPRYQMIINERFEALALIGGGTYIAPFWGFIFRGNKGDRAPYSYENSFPTPEYEGIDIFRSIRARLGIEARNKYDELKKMTQEDLRKFKQAASLLKEMSTYYRNTLDLYDAAYNMIGALEELKKSLIGYLPRG